MPNAQLLANDASLFSVIKNRNSSTKDLHGDLAKISNWAFQWNMNFNPDPAKQAQQVILRRKTLKKYPPFILVHSCVIQTTSQNI